MAGRLLEWANKGLIPEYDFWNKQNPMADPVQCGTYRPDFVYECADGVTILEFDEQMHSNRNQRCELVRMWEVSHGYDGRHVFWIRFNPDAFKVAGKTLTTSRKNREAVLLKLLQDNVGNSDYDNFMTICYVCYHKKEKTGDDLVQTFTFSRAAGEQAYEEWVDTIAPA